MTKFGIFFCMIIGMSSLVYGDALVAEAGAKAAKRMAMIQIPIKEVKTHFEGAQKTRPLNEQEKTLQKLTLVADLLKVTSVVHYDKNFNSLYPELLKNAIVNKMHEHPKWDVQLNAQELKVLVPDLEFLKTQFGAKSYGWAWFVKQQGLKAEAKKILIDSYEEKSGQVLQLTMVYSDDSSPLSEVQYTREALEPMIDAKEKGLLDSKMQKMKNHVSNLPNAMIMT